MDLELLSSTPPAELMYYPKDIPISDEGVRIAERLRSKRVKVNLFEARHVGEPPADLVEKYGKTRLRTMEETWGTIDDNLDKTGPTPINSVDEMLAGLGPNPVIAAERIPTKVTAPTARHAANPYFDIVEDHYPDIRGVDQSTAADWFVSIERGKVNTPSINLPGLSSEQRATLGQETVMHLLNALRDKGQAFCIAKILDLYTHDKEEADLSHIGGVNHLALPIILKQSYGITVEEERVGGAQPSMLRQKLNEYFPPHVATRLITRMDKKGFTYDSLITERVLLKHLDELKEVL